MYSVVIVDDEDILREGLRDAVPWEEWGFQVTALAGSGEEGLECLARIRPDVLMTDIKMYEFSGLDLLKAAKDIDPQCEVVLLSGYEDFYFAKQGLELGAAAYILKLNLFDELEQVFTRLRNELSARRQEARARNEVKQQSDAAELANRLRGEPTAGTGLHGDYRVAALWSPEGSEPLRAAVEQAAAAGGWKVAAMGRQIVAACIPFPSSPTARRIAWLEADSKLKSLAETANGTVMTGIGSLAPGAEIEASYRHALKMVDYGRLRQGGSRYVYEEIAPQLAAQPVDAPKYEDIQMWIDLNRTDELQRALARYMTAAVYDPKLSTADVKSVAMNVLVCLSNRAKEKEITLDPEWKINVLVTKLNLLDSMLDIRDWLLGVSSRLTELCPNKGKESEDLIEQAIRFIDRNFKNDISLQELAQSLYMSPSYLSVKFKDTVGMTFIDYVKMKRIDQASALLTETTKKIADIAREVGYDDEKYFSRVFKKEKGVSPQQFRDGSSGGKEEGAP